MNQLVKIKLIRNETISLGGNCKKYTFNVGVMKCHFKFSGSNKNLIECWSSKEYTRDALNLRNQEQKKSYEERTTISKIFRKKYIKMEFSFGFVKFWKYCVQIQELKMHIMNSHYKI